MARGSSLFAQLAGLGDFFSFGGGNAIGVSIGSSSVKIVELKKKGRGWKLLHFGIVQLPEDAIVNREIVNQVAIVESTRNLVNQLKLKNKSVCLGISSTALVIKRMSVEAQNMRELQDQVFWEAEQYLPFDVSEMVMDFHLIKKIKEKTADVLLVAIKKSTLEAYMQTAQDGGLKPKWVDTDLFALQNVYESNYPSNPAESVAIVDIGAASMKIVVVHNGVPVFTKDSVLGGKNLTAEIQKHLNLSYMDAETLKVGGQEGQAVPQEVSELTQIMCENFGGEIKRAIDFYSAASPGAPVASVLLAGGTAKLTDLSRIVEEQVGLPTQLLNPFNAISYDPVVFTPDYLAAIGPLAAIPVGLAIRAGAGAR